MMDIIDFDGERVPGPGFYRMSAARYHADCAPEPSLSASIAKVLLEKSPRHAWTAHPRLNPSYEAADEKKFDFGSAAHEIVLGKGDGIEPIVAADWRTKDAQIKRDDAIAEGRQPILYEQFVRASDLAIDVFGQLADAGLSGVFGDKNSSEIVMVWRDVGGIWCRAMLDWHVFEGAGLTVYDLKTSSTGVHPSSLGYKVADRGYEIQAGLYARGLETLIPALAGRITWRWVFVETDEPFAMTIAEMDGVAKTIGAKKAAAAVSLWGQCVEAGEWPLWASGVHLIEYPDREAQAWLAREMYDPMLVDLTAAPMLPEPGREPQTLEWMP